MKKNLARFLTFLLLLNLCCSSDIYVSGKTSNLTKEETEDKTISAPSSAVNITAKAAVLLEGSTGEILFEQNKDERLVPASITKIMTLILIFEALKSGKITLTDTVTISENAASMGGSQVYLEPHETQTVDTLLKCISIASANDAAVAMAEFVGGSENEFIVKMNEKAASLGMTNTNFLNCTGLDDDITSGHYSSAYDVALMSRELITKHPEISKYSTVWMDSFTHVTKKGESKFGLTNTNKLVRTYNGITGLKTGSTSKAKYCLSATAKRKGMDLIAVIMAAPDFRVRFSEAASLLDYGFANCTVYTDDHSSLVLEPIPIKKGLVDKITARPTDSFKFTCLKGEDPSAITKNIIYHKDLCAPLKKGDVVGEIEYYLGDKKLGTLPLVSKTDVKKARYTDCYFKAWNHFFLN